VPQSFGRFQFKDLSYFLEQAAKGGDVATFARILAELDPINAEFISLAAQRLGELVVADAYSSAG
jgi:hypothetical protein